MLYVGKKNQQASCSPAAGPAQSEPRTCVPQLAVCPASCSCNNNIVDCRRKGLSDIPANLPEATVEM